MKIQSTNFYNIQNLKNIHFASNSNPICIDGTKDTMHFTGNVKYIDENAQFLDDSIKPRPLKNLKHLSPEKLCLVHMSDFFPEGGEIKTAKNAAKDTDENMQYRSTVHFAINHSVREHDFGRNWQHMKYAVIMPMDGVINETPKENILGGKMQDFFIMDNVKLPDNSIILKYNPKIPEGKLKITDASKTMEDFKGTNGIKIIETSNKDTGETANKLVGKMGYTNYLDIIKKMMGLSDEEYKVMFDKEYADKLKTEDFSRYAKLASSIGIDNITKATEKTNKNWADFSKRFGFSDCAHTYSPWGRSESLAECIKAVSHCDDKWVHKMNNPYDISGMLPVEFDEDEFNLESIDLDEIPLDEIPEGFNVEDYIQEMKTFAKTLYSPKEKMEVDYKEEFLKVIDEIKDALPKGKRLSFDIDVLRNIIKNAETPSTALKEIKDKLNITTIRDVDNETAEQVYQTIDTVLCISEMQKEIMLNNQIE